MGGAPTRWGVSQLTQDQAQSAEEAPATGALDFDWEITRKSYGDLFKAMKERPANLAAAKAAKAEAAAAKKPAAAPAPALDQGGDQDLGVPQPQQRPRAASAP